MSIPTPPAADQPAQDGPGRRTVSEHQPASARRYTAESLTPQVSAWASPQERDWAVWRGQRLADLHSDFGWLTLASFEWLPVEPSGLSSVPGVWSARGLHAEIESEDGLLTGLDGQPITRLSLDLTEGESVEIAQFNAADRPFVTTLRSGVACRVDSGTVRIELGARAGRCMIRTRVADPEPADVPAYPYSASWVVSAVFEPYPSPAAENVASAREDTFLTAVVTGTVRFGIPGHDGDITLAVNDAGPAGPGRHSFTAAFRDKTNGKTTAPWRFASVLVYGEPGPDGWEAGAYNASIDFNRTLNYPLAFSSFAVCPAPVLTNVIPAPVTAGEQALVENQTGRPRA